MNTDQVTLVSVERSISDATKFKVTLQRGKDYVSCSSVIFWDDKILEKADIFSEWLEYAQNNDNGFSAIINAQVA
jgi:hypothetical protein